MDILLVTIHDNGGVSVVVESRSSLLKMLIILATSLFGNGVLERRQALTNGQG